MSHVFRTAMRIPHPVGGVFHFFAEAANLQRITPPALRFHIVTPEPIHMAEGARIDYRLMLRGIPFRWSTRISLWDPPRCFVDDQESGPYRQWTHTHRFTACGGETDMTDEVVYRLPLWPVGELAHPLVRREIGRIFAFRAHAIRVIFGTGEPFGFSRTPAVRDGVE